MRLGVAAKAGQRHRQVEKSAPVAGGRREHVLVAALGRLELAALPEHVAQVEVCLRRGQSKFDSELRRPGETWADIRVTKATSLGRSVPACIGVLLVGNADFSPTN